MKETQYINVCFHIISFLFFFLFLFIFDHHAKFTCGTNWECYHAGCWCRLIHQNMQYWKRTLNRLNSPIKTARNFPRNVPLRSTFHSGKYFLKNIIEFVLNFWWICYLKLINYKIRDILSFNWKKSFQVQPRLRNHALDYSGNGGGTAESAHSGRTSFFSKISSRFSKR